MNSRWLALGDAAMRTSLPEGAEPSAILAALRALPFARDAVVTERHAAVYFDGAFDQVRANAAIESALVRPTAVAPTPREHTVRVRYDGEDLDALAARAGLSRAAVIEIHAARVYTVRVIGFLPGFAYLGEVDPRIATPRLPSPRARVPAGAVGIAGARTGIYPFASPGGWNLIGNVSDFRAFDPERGAALALGDRVRFEPS